MHAKLVLPTTGVKIIGVFNCGEPCERIQHAIHPLLNGKMLPAYGFPPNTAALSAMQFSCAAVKLNEPLQFS